MRAPRRPRILATLALGLAGLLGVPALAGAHGGITIAEGGRGGTRILVQGTGEGPTADISTVLDGPGSGPGSKVVYWIRPKGRKRSFRVRTDRDAGGTHHAEIPTANRGSWQDWDVSAFVTLSTGRRLRVSNDQSDPPGPPEREAPSGGTTPPASTTGTTTATPPAATTEEPTGADDQGAVEDVSGEDDGTPGWVVPSIVVLVVLGLIAAVVRHRRLPDDPQD